MLTRNGENKRSSRSRAAVYEIGGSSAVAAAYSHSSGGAASQMTFPSAEHAATVSEFIARFDEAARQRLQRMNEKLTQLEMQMGQLEAEMSIENGISTWA